LLLILTLASQIGEAQLYERSGRNMGINVGYDYTSTSTSKKGFLPGQTGSAFRIGYMRTFGELIYTGVIFNYRMNNFVYSTDSLGNDFTAAVRTPSLQIPLLIQIPFLSIPLGKSKKKECTYLNTNFRIGPEFSYNLKSKSDFPVTSNNEWALQTAFGFNVSKSGGTHRRQAWDVQWHIVWRKGFNQMALHETIASSTKLYNNYIGLTLTVIRYATSSFL
jgi:hypothetical protein